MIRNTVTSYDVGVPQEWQIFLIGVKYKIIGPML